MKFDKNYPIKGFTLMETVIAIGIVAIILTSFLTVFAPATASVKRSIQVKEAKMLVTAVVDELTTLRPTKISATYTTGFQKAFDLINKGEALGGGKAGGIFVYSYRGDTSAVNTSTGAPTPFTDSDPIAGEDFILKAVTRFIDTDSDLITLETDALDGAVYFARVIPYQKNADGDLVLDSKVKPQVYRPYVSDPPAASDSAAAWEPETNFTNYTETSIPVSIELYQTPTTDIDFLLSAYNGPAAEDEPVYSYNTVIRR